MLQDFTIGCSKILNRNELDKVSLLKGKKCTLEQLGLFHSKAEASFLGGSSDPLETLRTHIQTSRSKNLKSFISRTGVNSSPIGARLFIIVIARTIHCVARPCTEKYKYHEGLTFSSSAKSESRQGMVLESIQE